MPLILEKGQLDVYKRQTLNDYMDKLALSKDWGNRNTVKVARIPAGIEVKYACLLYTSCIETGMMKNSEEAEKLIKEKGYLGLH